MTRRRSRRAPPRGRPRRRPPRAGRARRAPAPASRPRSRGGPSRPARRAACTLLLRTRRRRRDRRPGARRRRNRGRRPRARFRRRGRPAPHGLRRGSRAPRRSDRASPAPRPGTRGGRTSRPARRSCSSSHASSSGTGVVPKSEPRRATPELVRQARPPGVGGGPLVCLQRRVHLPAHVRHLSERGVGGVEGEVVAGGLEDGQRLLDERGQPARSRPPARARCGACPPGSSRTARPHVARRRGPLGEGIRAPERLGALALPSSRASTSSVSRTRSSSAGGTSAAARSSRLTAAP